MDVSTSTDGPVPGLTDSAGDLLSGWSIDPERGYLVRKNASGDAQMACRLRLVPIAFFQSVENHRTFKCFDGFDEVLVGINHGRLDGLQR